MKIAPDELFIIESGSKRRAVEAVCVQCGENFLKRRSDTKRNFCSPACVYESRRDKVELYCCNCGIKFYKLKSKLRSKHGKYFCSRKCKDAGQKVGGSCPEIRPAHYGTSPVPKKEKCASCGEITQYLLVVHHIDGNRENNKSENLEVVCKNCHAKRHLVFKNGKWCFSTTHLTPRAILSEV